MSTNACDTKVSMLFSLLLANVRILSCFFFLCLVIFSNFLTVPVVWEKNKVRLALAIPTDALTILVNKMTLHHVLHLKLLKLDRDNQKQQQQYLLNFFLQDFLWLISSIKQVSILLISSNRNLVWLVKFVLSIASIEFLSLIFEIRQNYIIVFLKIMWWKRVCIISQFFTC